MKLIIVRHGETEENVNGIFMGHLPGKLTEKGKEQTKKLAERLKGEKIDVIFSSDLARASDTTKEIVKFHTETPVYFIKELREKFQGMMQGKNKNEIKGWEIEEKRDRLMDEAGAESIDALIKRGGKVLEKLLQEHFEKDVLIVTHGGIITSINSYLLNENWMNLHREEKTHPKNTSITIFEFDENKKPQLKLMNCIKHLEENNGK